MQVRQVDLRHEDLKHHIQDICKECIVYQVFQKHPARPVIGLSLASSFQAWPQILS